MQINAFCELSFFALYVDENFLHQITPRIICGSVLYGGFYGTLPFITSSTLRASSETSRTACKESTRTEETGRLCPYTFSAHHLTHHRSPLAPEEPPHSSVFSTAMPPEREAFQSVIVASMARAQKKNKKQ